VDLALNQRLRAIQHSAFIIQHSDHPAFVSRHFYHPAFEIRHSALQIYFRRMERETPGVFRETLAEFLGTFVLILFGTGVVAQVVLSQQTAGTFLSINFAWGLAVTMGCYVAGGVSGAHMNPAVTIALAVHRGFSWSKVTPYVLAQVVGAFTAAAIVYFTYIEAINHFDGGVRQVLGPKGTAGIWATYPQPFLSTFPGGFIDQVVGTAILMLVILGITDARNAPPASGMAPLIVGLLVTVIGMSFGFNAGYAINPARDFGPRLFTALGGWGADVFRASNGWWWVPIVAPVLGAVIGGWIYDLCVGDRFPRGVPPTSPAAQAPPPQPGQLPPV
jgi:MIP family channel proteins